MIGCGRVAFIDPVLRQRRATRPPAFTLFLLIDDECKKMFSLGACMVMFGSSLFLVE